MLLTDALLLHYQRCPRRAFLDVHGDLAQRDPPSDYLLKLFQDSLLHQRSVLTDWAWLPFGLPDGPLTYHRPIYPEHDWQAGASATLELMQQGVDAIHQGILLITDPAGHTFISKPDLLVKQPGDSLLGDWHYVPVDIKLGKRPKLEYQLVAAYQAHLLAQMQGAWPEAAWLILRQRGAYEVDLVERVPRMQSILEECTRTLSKPVEPEVFISRNRCSLCHWYGHCYDIAQQQQHLSLLPGVTPSRYSFLQGLKLTTVESLALARPAQLEPLPGFGREVAQKLVWQAQATLSNQAILVADPSLWSQGFSGNGAIAPFHHLPTAPVEFYFDIEAEPDLNLAYLHGVLMVDRRTQTETFYPFLAEDPSAEAAVWKDFLELMLAYPQSPVFHFCAYEVQTVRRLAQLYNTPLDSVEALLHRFVDLHAWVTRTVMLPVESYALKPIARWVGFDWRDASADGAQSIYWYNQWLTTGDRSFLDSIVCYNEDDCRATYHVKDWLVEFLRQPRLPYAYVSDGEESLPSIGER